MKQVHLSPTNLASSGGCALAGLVLMVLSLQLRGQAAEVSTTEVEIKEAFRSSQELVAKGEYAEALARLEEALETSESILGEDAHATLLCRNEAAALLYHHVLLKKE